MYNSSKEQILCLSEMITLSPAIIDIIFENPDEDIIIQYNKIAEIIREENK